MAELTKDDIKEALGFIADGKRILGIFDKAESAIAVLGQLNATVDSLGKKAEGLRAEVVALEGQKAAFATEREKQKEELDNRRAATMADILKEANDVRMQAAMKEGEISLKIAEAIAERDAERVSLEKLVSDLALNRDAINVSIRELKKSQVAEQSRLDTLIAKIAELKSRL